MYSRLKEARNKRDVNTRHIALRNVQPSQRGQEQWDVNMGRHSVSAMHSLPDRGFVDILIFGRLAFMKE